MSPAAGCARWLRIVTWLLVIAASAEPVKTCTAAEPARGMVVSVSPPGSEAGAAILRQGGNAVDAAVATAFALAVTWPAAGNIGGGGFMMVYPGPGQEPLCIEYRETAPAAATATMFGDDGRMNGHKVVGVPGTVAGMAEAHRRFGSLPWRDVLAPAIKLAGDGFAVNRALADSLNGVLRGAPQFAELQRVFAPPGGKPRWEPGDRLVQPDLARTLQAIAAQGLVAFYHGPIAQQLFAEMRRGGGLITMADLAAYQANVRPAIHGTYRGYDIYGPPPPSSGGIVLVEMLNILENFPLRQWRGAAATPGRWSPDALHVATEAMRRAYFDRARWLGDPAFTPIPSHLVDKDYARSLAAQIDPRRATPSDRLTPPLVLAEESPQTTHFSVIDRHGMAVSNTYTLQNAFGSRVVVRGAGFLLNNEMTDFNRTPGRTDHKGAIGTPPNLVAPGKRMLSSQTPTLVVRDGRLVLVTGSPGGRTIINTVLCTVLNYVDADLDARSLVDAPRLHHQWLPDVLRFEGVGRAEYQACVAELQARGHTVDAKPPKQGDAHVIAWDAQSGRYVGAADQRTDGKVVQE